MVLKRIEPGKTPAGAQPKASVKSKSIFAEYPIVTAAIGVLVLALVGGTAWLLLGGHDDDDSAEPTTAVEATPTAEAEPTVTPVPTSTPVLTATPIPTATAVPEPTSTPQPQPTATPEPTLSPDEQQYVDQAEGWWDIGMEAVLTMMESMDETGFAPESRSQLLSEIKPHVETLDYIFAEADEMKPPERFTESHRDQIGGLGLWSSGARGALTALQDNNVILFETSMEIVASGTGHLAEARVLRWSEMP